MTEGNQDGNTASAAPAIESFQEKLESWTATQLGPYLERLKKQRAELEDRPLPLERKEINDTVWGTVVLQPLELVVLDSPILQRLRAIRQLGVVHLVYPSGVHTRFEHSIGAVHQVTRVIRSINEHSGVTHRIIDRPNEDLLRLAALVHDVGHGLMSHVSENALKNFEEVEDMRLDFADALEVEDAALSEIAAYFIVGSPAFRDLIDAAEQLLRVRDLPPRAVDSMQSAILGKQISQKVPLPLELISGPFDADKLDYMTRDAQMTGVPVVTDIPRLVQKVRAVDLPIAELPAEVQRVIDRKEASYWLTGIAMSGGRTLDELLIGRTFLFDKLYRHQKVRAAEAMIASIIREVAPLCSGGPAMFPYAVDDAGLLELREDAIAAIAGRTPMGDELARAQIGIDLAQRLKRRELFVRAYAFAQNMPLDPYRGDRTHIQGLRDLSRDCSDALDRQGLVDAIVAELKKILSVLSKEGLLGALPNGALEAYVWLDPPQPPKGGTVISQAYLLGGSRRWLRFGEETAEAPGWTNAYLLTRDIGYVFTLSELAPYAFLATERVVRDRYQVRTPRTMFGYAKQDEETVDDLKAQLASLAYYDDAPFDLRPRPSRLNKGDVHVRLGEIAERFAGYQGPVSPEDVKEEKRAPVITPARAEDWLRQFEDDELIESALKVLDHVEFVGRPELVEGLHRFLEEHPEFHNGVLSRLGTLRDSSSILAYQAFDAGATYGLRASELGTALIERKPVVFVDDFVGRGAQAVSIFETWLGVDLTYELGEERGGPLSEDGQAALKEIPIAVVFSSGTDEGAKTLQSRCADLGLNMTVAISHRALPAATEDRLYGGSAQKDRFLEKCEAIGRQLLLESGTKHDAEWVKDKGLGYGNKAYLVVFPYNTPSQTLTCLWASGEAEGIGWQPLFPRRKKE